MNMLTILRDTTLKMRKRMVIDIQTVWDTNRLITLTDNQDDLIEINRLTILRDKQDDLIEG